MTVQDDIPGQFLAKYSPMSTRPPNNGCLLDFQCHQCTISQTLRRANQLPAPPKKEVKEEVEEEKKHGRLLAGLPAAVAALGPFGAEITLFLLRKLGLVILPAAGMVRELAC